MKIYDYHAKGDSSRFIISSSVQVQFGYRKGSVEDFFLPNNLRKNTEFSVLGILELRMKGSRYFTGLELIFPPDLYSVMTALREEFCLKDFPVYSMSGI